MNNINRIAAVSTAALALLLTGCSQQQIAGSSSQQVAGSSQQVAGSSQQVAGSSQQVAGTSQQQASSQQVAGTSQQQAGSQQQAQPTKPVTQPSKPASRPQSCTGCNKPVVRPARQSGHVHPAIPNCTKSVRHNHRSGNKSHSHKYGCSGRKAIRRAAPVRRAPVRRASGAHSHPAVPNCTKSVRHYHKGGKRPHSHKYGCQKRRAAAPRACRPCRTAPQPYVKPYVRRPASRGNRWTHTHPAIPRCTKSVRHTHKYNRRNHNHAYGCRKPVRRAAPHRAQKSTNRVDIHRLQSKLKAKGYYRGPINGVVNPATRSALHRYQQNR